VKEKVKVKTPLDNFYLFKSCTAGALYPGIEISIRYVLDRIGAHYIDDPRQSSCTGFAVYSGLVPFQTNLALNARNLSLAAETADRNVLCTCPASYSNIKYCQKLISKDEKLEVHTREVLENIGMQYDCSSGVFNPSDVFLARSKDILRKAKYSLSGINAITHHGCHYSKIFFEDVSPGTGEKPMVLDDIVKGFGGNVIDYAEIFLCCGMGFHHTLVDREYPRAVLRRKFTSIAGAGPDIIITQCPGCTFNLDYYQESMAKELSISLDIPVLHFSELEALLLGANPEDIGLDMHAVPVEPLLEKIGIKGAEN
jgi:heterodisulfide reductase subunit B1